MKRVAQEAEVIARLDFQTGETHITVVSWPSMARRMERLYGKSLDMSGQVRRWKVRGLAVGFRKPRKDAVLAPAVRENRAVTRLSQVARRQEA